MSSSRIWKNMLLGTLLVGVSTWAAADPLPLPASVNTSATPAAVSLGGQTYVFYKGSGTDTNIFVTTSSSPLGPWTDASLLPPPINTSAAPAAVVQGTTLYVVFKAVDPDPGIYVARLIAGAGWWLTKLPNTVNTSTGPNAYIASDGALYVVYKGAGGDSHIWVMPLPADLVWIPL